MKVIAEITLDSSWDEYQYYSKDLLEEDLFENLNKEGILSAKIVDIVEQPKDEVFKTGLLKKGRIFVKN
jgi:hypothetical protein